MLMHGWACIVNGPKLAFDSPPIHLTFLKHRQPIFKVEYHATENPLKHSEKIAYIGQRLLYPIIKENNPLPL